MYEDAHRFFVQFMLKKKYVSIDAAQLFARSIQDNLGTLKNLKNFIMEINGEISKQELKIAIVKCEVTEDTKVLLLNTANDDITKLQNGFTSVELEYFQTLFKELITIPEHKISTMACFNLSGSVANSIRKDNVETVLEKWRKEGYLVVKDSFTYLGARCIVEFAPYFSQHCKEYLSNCYLCSELVVLARNCSKCKKGMHSFCIEKYLEKQSRCPSCKTAWAEVQADGNTAESSSESEVDSSPIAGPSTRKRLRLA